MAKTNDEIFELIQGMGFRREKVTNTQLFEQNKVIINELRSIKKIMEKGKASI